MPRAASAALNAVLLNPSDVDNDHVVGCALRLSRTKVVLALLRASGPVALLRSS
jgi:hypothetical protein